MPGVATRAGPSGASSTTRRCNVMAWSGFGLTLGLWGIVLMATKDMPTTGVDADKRVVDRALMKAQVKQGQADQAWWLQGSADSPQQRPTVQTAEPRAQPKSTQSPAAPASAATHAVATPRYGLDTTFFLTPIQTPPPTVSAALPTATPGAAPGQPLPLTKACVAAAKAVPSRSKFTLTHVINPFPTTDVHFNFTVRSIIAAVQYARARNITVQVLGITFDNELVELPEEITAVPEIPGKRSAGAYLQSIGVELGAGEKPLRTPVVKDVFGLARRHAEAPVFVWTNFDLILKENFYVEVARSLETHVGFSVLRLDLMIERAAHPDVGQWSIDQIYAYGDTRAQGGHDCLVFPARWLSCLDYRDFVFGVGGWGYAIFGELIQLSQLEGYGRGARSGGFTVLKPGVHLDKAGITRHIGSQNANPQRYYSNPVPWLGPLRRNQLQYNMRMKFEVELQLSLVAKSACRGQYFPGAKHAGAQQCPPAKPAGGYARCPLKRSGALQPVAVAFPSAATAPFARRVFEGLTQMAVGTVHSPGAPVGEITRHALVITHAQRTVVQPEAVWDAHNASDAVPAEPKGKWGPPTWDTVLVLIDPDPVGTVLSWYGGGRPATAPAAGGPGGVKAALAPLVARYVAFYEYWIRQHTSGGVPIVLLNLGSGSAIERGEELTVAAEVVLKAKLGVANRWCRGAPKFDVCCAVAQSDPTLVAGAGAAASPREEHTHWLEGKLGPITATLQSLWRRERRQIHAGNISACCPSALFDQGGAAPRPPRGAPESSDTRAPAQPAPPAGGPVAASNSSAMGATVRRGRVAQALPGLFALLPNASRDPRFKAPCWKHAVAKGGDAYSCTPSFFLLGQVKCGTTDMFASLARHPQIVRTVKEQHWFSREWYKGDKYLAQFSFPEAMASQRESMLIGDGTPDYIWSNLRCLNRPFQYPNDGTTVTIAEALAELNPVARLLLMLREPVARLYSDFHYFLHRRERDIAMPPEKEANATHFHQYVEHGLAVVRKCLEKGSTMDQCVWTSRTMVFAAPTRLVMGCYAPFIKEYLRNFNREQLLVFTLDDYHADSKAVLSAAFDHIGADAPKDDDAWGRIMNRPAKKMINQQGARYKASTMLPETRALLVEFYRPCTQDLGKLLNTTAFDRWL